VREGRIVERLGVAVDQGDAVRLVALLVDGDAHGVGVEHADADQLPSATVDVREIGITPQQQVGKGGFDDLESGESAVRVVQPTRDLLGDPVPHPQRPQRKRRNAASDELNSPEYGTEA
jgi:hypothetical protein